MKMIAVTIQKTQLEADLLNPNVMRKYDAGIKEVVEKANKASLIQNSADAVEEQCRAVIDFIDSMFGAGSARKALGEEVDLLTCVDAFEELVDLYDKQVNPLISQRSDAAFLKASERRDA